MMPSGQFKVFPLLLRFDFEDIETKDCTPHRIRLKSSSHHNSAWNLSARISSINNLLFTSVLAVIVSSNFP